MTRRTFLKSLGVAGAGVATGLSMLPRSKEIPLWATAKYEPERQHPYYFERHYCDIKGVHTIKTGPYFFDSKHTYFHLIDGEWRRAEWA